ncbi:hypothetical protein TWF694_002753 [Orbilia ellipsospora]|uniref:Fungal N-terminal domain-containing protein n=1 Tax=Orbilia ellipsospora TaxID=2528407 RepID=A0AAV9X383_9PEZI
MDISKACRGLVSPLDLVAAKLSTILSLVGSAENTLDFLIQNVRSIEIQLATVQEYVARAELSTTQRERCGNYVCDIELRTVKLISQLDLIINKLKDRSICKKPKQKTALVGKEVQNLRDQIDKIGENLSAVREEMLLSIALDDRAERRKDHFLIRNQLDVIEANTEGSDARKIKKYYKSSAQSLLADDFSNPPEYNPAASYRQQTQYGQTRQETLNPFFSPSQISFPPNSLEMDAGPIPSSIPAGVCELEAPLALPNHSSYPSWEITATPEKRGYYRGSNVPQWTNAWEH